MHKTGIFVISLDFELHWGGFEKWPLDLYVDYFLNTRKVILEMLDIFQSNNIHATWATVGLLMHKNKAELLNNLPTIKPTYALSYLSAYDYIEKTGIGDSEEMDPFHYAFSLIQQIKKIKGQEIGTHTFSHYYCNEMGQQPNQFHSDIMAAKVAAKSLNVYFESLVFPRNQYNPEYLKICAEEGIKIVRTNPLDWWWQIDSAHNESKWKRLNRGMDAYFSIGGKTSYKIESLKQTMGVILLPASRLLRPYNPKELFLNNLKIKRIKKEMSLAALNKEVYHLWWHPHNFGHFPKNNLDGLVEIVEHAKTLSDEYGMKSLNMGEIAYLFNNEISEN
ncbi:polysaccharide deacetylase family protein [Fulvivirga ulvae]|uniref:polysaccharide deacetylase family protein n=1 Tax=Fulvivirga ulvae TaxID=2904245 RepID=UPI001F36D0C4|nr:polysaccharide deacetylase family protein [Fulvivirga ulvae]UII31645.1 polysaccharide deacetylase family protein [Fulvivirga ulvae]